MMNTAELTRIARQLNLPGYDRAAAEKLHDARVLIVGAGGLGCPAMQALAATGLGRILLYDDDTVGATNLHRQILFTGDDVGRPKAEIAAAKLAQIQPGIDVDARVERLTSSNILDAVGEVDLVLDGSDTFATKYLVADACEITSTPLVWGTVLRYEGQLALFGGSAEAPMLRDLFPVQPPADSVPDCATAGVLGVTTSVIGSLMATEAVKYLTGIGDSVPGKVVAYDALATRFRSYMVPRDPARPAVRTLPAVSASGTAPSVDPERERLLGLLARGEARALDVREEHEKLLAEIPTGADLHLPTSQLDDTRLREVLSGIHGTVVCYCASGVRSQRVVDDYSVDGVTLVSLPGGVGSR
ncbi:hypothetical protein C3B44_04260 [Corynebacterium yudongzhengii]|uniref:Rhodanese domain-containing protein n=1 Tax=Corynebacterium yudongzhengii TaxID=2080740 RepID=A0A2U1T678_9CORY|nr:ThiF family adenylyltransferase [Corynebacterium yudongzhengii]AWB81676.1 hypothetical protein C3B44_04260 [Corynebacterium yudongzhengii]PWC01521.1 hypothetical protein DF222_06915 [Corynebacterium yudongzhengii]